MILKIWRWIYLIFMIRGFWTSICHFFFLCFAMKERKVTKKKKMRNVVAIIWVNRKILNLGKINDNR